MGKKHNNNSKPKTTLKTYKPFVSVCTPTFNRRPFIPIMFDCFRNQTYPKDRIEWIIVDDGSDRIKDLVEEVQRTDIPQIKYFEVDRKMSLGEKRNYMHKQCKGSIIVYMDDDDYYPPQRIEHAVEKLMGDKQALCAGSSEMYVYFKHIHKMYQCGPYGPNHATAGTFAFKSRLLDDTQYENHAALAEEKAFLKNYTIPFVQLDPMKTILVFSHNHNTFDKKKLLDNPHPDYMKESPKTVDMFIRGENEKHIYKFFMNDIDAKLEAYEPGHPRMKPDVLEQTKKIEQERAKQAQEEMQKQGAMPVLTVQEQGKAPRQVTLDEVVQMMNKLQEDNRNLHMQNMQLQQQLSMGGNNMPFMPAPIVHNIQPSSASNDEIEQYESIIFNLQKKLNETEIKLAKAESEKKMNGNTATSVSSVAPSVAPSVPVTPAAPVDSSISKSTPEVVIPI